MAKLNPALLALARAQAYAGGVADVTGGPGPTGWQRTKAGLWSGAAWAGWGLDIFRRGIAYTGYRLGGFGHRESIETSRTGRRLIETLSPEFAREHPTATSLLGFGQEVWADPINIMLMGGLTTTGLAAKKAGKLGITWGRQARAGQRVMLQMRLPTFKPGWSWAFWSGKGIQRVPIIRAPRGVEALAQFGNFLARPFSKFRTVSPNPFVRHVVRIGEGAAPDVHAQMLRIGDAVDEFRKGVPESMWPNVQMVADHVGKTGELHMELLRPFDRQTLELGAQWKSLMDSLKDISERVAGRGDAVGRSLANFVEETSRMESRQITQMAKKVNKHAKGLDRKMKGAAQGYLSAQAKARRAQEQAVRLMDEAWDLELTGRLTGEQKGRLTERIRVANLDARRFEREAIRKTNRMFNIADAAEPGLEWERKKFHALRAKEVLAETARENLPNNIPRAMTPDGIRMVMKRQKPGGGLGKWVYTDDFLAHQERRWTEQFHRATMAPVKPYEKVGRVVKRERGLLEIDELFRNPIAGTAEAQYAAIPDGIIERVGRFITRKAPKPLIEKMYKLDLMAPVDRMIKRTMNGLQTRAMLDEVLGMPELFTRTLGAGQDAWIPLRKLSTAMAKRYGTGFIHPELFRAIRSTTSNIRFPDSVYGMVKAMDKFTQTFKKAVTGWWPAYSWRNHVTDTIFATSIGVNPTAAWRDGSKAIWHRGLARMGVDTTIDCGAVYGRMAPDDVHRMARALGVTFGEVSEAGVKGIPKQFEDIRRIGALVDRVRAGFTWQQAALEVKSVLFDYKQLSPLEKHLLRRVIPFYSWFRNNVKLQAQWAFHTPALTQAQLRLRRPKGEELPYIPSWVKGRTYISMSPDKQTGQERILLGLDLPVEDIAEMLDFDGGWRPWVKRLAFKANPLLKLGVGLPTGYDLDRATLLDKPVSAPYMRAMHKEGGARWAFAQRVFGARVNKTRKGETYYTIGPYWDFVIRNTPASRYWNTFVKRPGADYQKYARGEIPAKTAAIEHAVGFLTGYRIHRFDREEQRRRNRMREADKALRSLARVGDVRFYGVPYRPEGSMAPEQLIKDLANARAGR